MVTEQDSHGTALFRSLVDEATQGMLIVAEDGEIRYANEAVASLMGRTPAAIEGNRLQEFSDLETETLSSLWSSPQEPDEPTIETSLRRSDGGMIPVRIVRHGQSDTDNSQYALSVHHETADDSQDGRLSEAKERFEKIFHYTNDGILILDPENDAIVDSNPQACELLGYSREELLELDPVEIHPHEVDRFRSFIENILTEGDGWSDELSCYTRAGERIPAEISASRIDLDDRPHVLASIRDISERREREEELHRYRRAVETANDGIVIIDSNGDFLTVNQAYARMHGYDGATELEQKPWTHVYPNATERRIDEEIMPVVESEGFWRGELDGQRADGSLFPQELTLTAIEDGDIVGIVRDISEKRQQQRQLRELNESARELMRAETSDEIATQGLNAMKRVIGHPVGCIRIYDEESNTLDRVATTDEARELLDTRPAYDLEASRAGRAYRDNQLVVSDAPTDPAAETNGSATDDDASIHLPIGDRGTLTIIDPDGGTFDDRVIGLMENLAENIRAALARAERESELRDNERELRQRREELQTFDQINALIRNVIDSLIGATTRTTIESTVCEQLADSELYSSAWIAEVMVGQDDIEPRTGAGVSEAFLETQSAMALEEIAEGTVEQAIKTGEVRILQRLEISESGDPIESSETGSFKAVASVPITYGDRIHGVLIIEAARRNVFSDTAREALKILGETIGFAVTAVRNRELLLTNDTVELEFELPSSDGFFADISAELDCVCVHEGDTQTQEGNVIHFVRIEGADAEAVKQRAMDAEQVSNCRIIDDRAEECRIEIVIQDSPPEIFLEMGARVRNITAEEGTSTITAEAPQEADLRAIVDRVQSRYSGAELVAKREVTGTDRSMAQFSETVEERLTDRQQSVLETAYRAGYYDWPRESTAEDVAETLEISSSTFHQHVRRAEQALLSVFFEDTDDRNQERS